MPMDSEDIRAELDLSIDEQNLMNEWQGQASLMLDWGIRLADAQQQEDEAKAYLAAVTAEIDSKIRANPTNYDVVKVTETTVSNTIIEQQSHVTATNEYLEAKHEKNMLQAAVNAISHRKSSLQGMSDLFLRQWHADPKSPVQPIELQEAAKTITKKKIAGRRTRRTSKPK